MKVAFLCGAGISIPAGMPSTCDITSKILSGDGVVRYTDETYYLGQDPNPQTTLSKEHVSRVCRYLAMLKAECNRFYRCDRRDIGWFGLFGKHETNYEDIFYLAVQIKETDTREFDNPAVQPLIDKIRASEDFKELLRCHEGESRRVWSFPCIRDEAVSYIRSVVTALLEDVPERPSGLGLFAEACQDLQSGPIDVYTLNHDTVFETFCRTKGLSLCDGFSQPVNGVRYWDPCLLDTCDVHIRLLKLHGSCNWYPLTPDSDSNEAGRIGIVIDGDVWHSQDPNGELQRPSGPPLMLVGTFNKLMAYTAGTFRDLHARFYNGLQQSDNLVVVGYGFGDKGINEQILDWLAASSDRKMAVIDPSQAALDLTARGAVRRNWRAFSDAGRLVHLPKGIQETSWAEVRDALSRPPFGRRPDPHRRPHT